jgi:hypothetical protein
MTTESRLALPASETPLTPPPAPAGWMPAAMAIHGVQSSRAPMILHLDIAGAGSVTIDVLRRAYDGGLTAERFPTAPESVRIETTPTFPGAPPVFALPGAELDALLWHIGYHAFPDGAAPWLPVGARLRLSRWPNLSDLPITLDQVRMTAMLGNGAATVDELAVVAGVDAVEARSVINAFALVGILRAVDEPRPEPVAAIVEASASRGLFARLRERLGL